MRTTNTKHKKQGFSIIELMVVIGIILILAGLSSVGVRKLQSRSREIQCTNNMKQWMIAMLQYNDEHKGLFPGDGTEDASIAWFEVLPPYIGLTKFSEQVSAGNVPVPGSKSLFICPTDLRRLPAEGNTTYAYSYGMNYWINAKKAAASDNGKCCEGNHLSPRMMLSQVRHPDVFVVFSELEGTPSLKSVALHPPGSAASKPAFRHGNRVNCGFADGHVAGIPMQSAHMVQWNPRIEPGNEPIFGSERGGN